MRSSMPAHRCTWARRTSTSATAASLSACASLGSKLPDGAIITSAHIEFQARLTGGSPADLTIAVENTADAASFGSGGADIAGRDYLDQTTAWSPEARVKGETDQTADLAAILAAMVGTGGIDADDAFAFRISGDGERTAWSFDVHGEAPTLVIDYEDAADPPAWAEVEFA